MAKKFTLDELIFADGKKPPEEIVIECSKCKNVMLDKPHQATCCGKLFCGSCHEKESIDHKLPGCSGPYKAFPDKNVLGIVTKLKVHCIHRKRSDLTQPQHPPSRTGGKVQECDVPICQDHYNSEKGCDWTGPLENLLGHIGKGEVELHKGLCHLEPVQCQNVGCKFFSERCARKFYEGAICSKRPSECRYCGLKDNYENVEKHYSECKKFPEYCPKKCDATKKMPRCEIDAHLDKDCPKQNIKCEFHWAGCKGKPLRQDAAMHMRDVQVEHLKMVASKLKKDIEELKEKLQMKGGKEN